MLTHSGMYALRAVVYLAVHGGGRGRPVQAAEIASAVGMPRNYLSKVLHALVRAGVLASVRGPGGGFRLARDAGALTVAVVVAPFEAESHHAGCVLGETCGPGPCPAHGAWGGIAESIRRFFRTTTVSALAGTSAEAVRREQGGGCGGGDVARADGSGAAVG